MTAADFRARARELLRGRWGMLMPLALLAQLFASAFFIDIVYQVFFSQPYPLPISAYGLTYVVLAPKGAGWAIMALSMLLMLFSGVLAVGLFRALREAAAGGRPSVATLFPMRQAGRVMLMNLLRDLLVGVQLMLLFIPGLIAILRYSMADYLMAENPDMGPIEALRESRVRMRGHKAECFVLSLSFFGWLLLSTLALMLLDELLLGETIFGAPTNPWLYALASLAYNMLGLLVSLPLQLYISGAQFCFFDHCNGANANTWAREEARSEAEPQAEAADSGAAGTASSIEMEAEARALYFSYGCSYNRMRDAGALEQYAALNASRGSEERWRREYAQALMLRFDREPEALDDILSLAAEYAMDDLAGRAIERIERHIRQSSLPDAEVLNMCGRVLAMLTSGAFDENPGFIERRRAQILDMAARLEGILRDEDPDGEWRAALKMIREM